MLVTCTLSALNLQMVHCDKELIKGVMHRASDGSAMEGTGKEVSIYPHPRHYLIKVVLCSGVRFLEEYQYPHPWVGGDSECFLVHGVGVHMEIFQFLLLTTYRLSFIWEVYNIGRTRRASDSSVRPCSMWIMWLPYICTYKYT